MSLLHQALKKLESPKQDYTAANAALPRPAKWGKKVIISLLAVALASIFLGVYFSRGIKGKGIEGNEAKEVKADAALAPQQAIEISGQAHNERGVYHYNLLQFNESIDEFKKGLSLEPSNSALYNNLGLAYMGEGRYDEAKEAFIQALKLKPDYPEALNNYGALMDREGGQKRAVGYFKKALELSPGYAHAHLNMAIALERMEEYEAAVKHYEAYLKLNPDKSMDDDVKKKIARLSLFIQRPGR
ncbi:MAG: tetratricopeptide repeat protein [Deltaproteobacteria bacterium]|nr:tetratricopeptide repeat protein [Deltaproteobacteria bacterium]